MEKIIREYRTTPAEIDLTGAQPGIDWKGDKRLEMCLKMLQEADIDWQSMPEANIAKWVMAPEGTRVTRLFYKVYIYQFDEDRPTLFAEFEHCDFPNALFRQMADYKNDAMTARGMFVQACASSVYPNGCVNDCSQLSDSGKTFMLNSYMTGHPSYPGSPHIALLLLMAKEKEEWNEPANFDLSDGYPLNRTEQATLFHSSHLDTRLTISLGRNYQKATGIYCDIDAREFPEKLIEHLKDDDAKGLLNDVTSIQIDAAVKTSIHTFQRTYTYSLPDDYPPKWDVCKVDFDWRADHNSYGDSKCYARPGTFAAFKHPVIYSLHPIRIDDMDVPSRGAGLFGIPQILYYDSDSMTISYGDRKVTITPDKPFTATEGIDYATFDLSIRLAIDK
ncbi:MAG: hypothetical protein J6031_03695 [Bacteroidales bacterium]|nr:hypothetical protein [Bacteroidales bacterium]